MKNDVPGTGFYKTRRTEVLSERRKYFEEELEPEWMQKTVPHPFLGFVSSPPTPADDLGFQNKTSLFQKKGPEKWIVLITGGSVARYLAEGGAGVLKEQLEQIPEIAGREIVFLRAAVGGYKQPQQLMALNYLFQLGAEFDLIINVDGFNDVALGAVENTPHNVNPLFPRRWFAIAGARRIPEVRLAVFAGNFLIGSRIFFAELFSISFFRDSAALNLFWKTADAFLENGIFRIHNYLAYYKPQEAFYEITGPAVKFSDPKDLYEYKAEAWARSSKLMSQISRANQAFYYHFLQPNQYDPGSKKMTPEEKRVGYEENSFFKNAVAEGYPIMKEKAGEMLKGVEFHDLSMIFAGIEEPIYRDKCCHYNQKGYEILGREIGRLIRESFKKAA